MSKRKWCHHRSNGWCKKNEVITKNIRSFKLKLYRLLKEFEAECDAVHFLYEVYEHANVTCLARIRELENPCCLDKNHQHECPDFKLREVSDA